MMCFSPITKNMKVKIPGIKDRFGKQRYEYKNVTFPCGKCFACLQNLRSDWIFRLKQELAVSSSCYFVTLTYPDEYLPISSDGLPTLDKEQLKAFLHRFRNSFPKGTKFKYFLVGEYGGLLGRPHYHMLLFNLPYDIATLHDNISMMWCDDHSIVDVRLASGALIGYITKYMLKAPDDNKMLTADQEPCFRLVSNGMGKSFITPALAHRLAYGNSSVVSDGDCKRRLPRYWKDKLIPLMADDLRKNGVKGYAIPKRIRHVMYDIPKKIADFREEKLFNEFGYDYTKVKIGRQEAYVRNQKKLIKQKEIQSKFNYLNNNI